MKGWETFYMQTFHQRNILINEQQVNDINPLSELADTPRVLLRVTQPSLTLHNT